MLAWNWCRIVPSRSLSLRGILPITYNPWAHHLNCGLRGISCFPRRMENCVTASLVNFAGWRLFPDPIFAPFAGIKPLQGCDVYRVNYLVKTVK